MELVEKLSQWLTKPGNSRAKLAAQLGYKTSDVISQWLCRKRIPSYQEQRVIEIVNKKEKKNETT